MPDEKAIPVEETIREFREIVATHPASAELRLEYAHTLRSIGEPAAARADGDNVEGGKSVVMMTRGLVAFGPGSAPSEQRENSSKRYSQEAGLPGSDVHRSCFIYPLTFRAG